MIPVAPPPEPPNFDADCRVPGQQWLAAQPSGTNVGLPNHWRHFLPELGNGFRLRCGYLAMFDMNGTVDHFLSTSTQPHLAYEWTNLRYATGWLNSSKQAVNVALLDPFTIREEWFEIDLASLHLRLTAAMPKHLAQAAKASLRRLKLDYGPRTTPARQFYLAQFQAGQFTLQNLDDLAPLIATAIRRERLLQYLGANPPVSRQDIANICDASPQRASKLGTMWRLAGHLRAVGRGPHVRYELP